MTQKEAWAARAVRYETQARILRKSADAIDAEMNSIDVTYFTDRGTLKQKDRLRARWGKASEMRAKADAADAKAANLRVMSRRNKGDAERKTQAKRDATSVQVGDYAAFWGPRRRVEKVNRKTVRLAGYSEAVDKLYLSDIITAEEHAAAHADRSSETE